MKFINEISGWQKTKHCLPVPHALVICQDADDEYHYFISQLELVTFNDSPAFCFRDYYDNGYDHTVESVKKWAYIKL